MLDFRRHSSVPNYLGSTQQRRLLLLVGVAAVIAVLVFQSRRPPGGGWLGENRLLLADRGAKEGSSQAADEPGPGAAAGGFFPGVREDDLRGIEDDTVFRTEEHDAWFHLLSLLERSDPRDLERASLGRVAYVQLEGQPNAYRGRLVTLAGIVRAAKAVSAPQNDSGIERYFQLWLQPDLGSAALVVVYALELSRDFPLGEELNARCTTTGFFFKRWAYASRRGVTTAPLVVARTVDWEPLPAPPPQPPLGEQLLWAVFVALVLAIVTVGFVAIRSRRAVRRAIGAADSAGEFSSRELAGELARREDAHSRGS